MNIAKAYEIARTPLTEALEAQNQRKLEEKQEESELKATLHEQHANWLNHPYTGKFLQFLAIQETQCLSKARTLVKNSGHATEPSTNLLLESATYRKILDYASNSLSD